MAIDLLESSSDASLVVAVARRNERALEELYRRHADAITTLARRVLRDPALAADIAQEIFVRLWQKPERFDAERGSLRAFLLAEHGGLPLVPDMLKNSRTTVTNVVVRTLAWNMPHHTAHHALPTVPFHRLPALTRRLQPHIAATARGYVAAHADYRRTWPRQHPSA